MVGEVDDVAEVVEADDRVEPLTQRAVLGQDSEVVLHRLDRAEQRRERRDDEVEAEVVQLRRRHWIITDGNGEVREVEGPGVVGEEPVIRPGSAHQYTSGAVLPTPVGTMEGTYEMHRPGGERFHAAIPLFALRCPGVVQ